MKKILSILLPLLLVASAFGQTTYNPPTVYVSSGLTVKRTAGTVNNGGKPVAVAADGTGVAMTDEKTDCSAPTYTSCNIIYAGSTGTVSVTTAIATAAASGNTIIAYVSTHLVAVTSIVYGWQNGAVFSNQSSVAPGGSSSIVKSCGTTSTCALTLITSPKVVFGSVALASASPSLVTVTALPFTSSSTYFCTAVPEGTTAAIAAAGVAISKTDGANVVFTGPNTVTTVIDYYCIGT